MNVRSIPTTAPTPTTTLTVIPTSTPATPTSAVMNAKSKNKRGRSTDLFATEIVVLFCEKLAAHAHIAPHSTKTERFEIAADALNVNCDFSIDVDAKGVRDKYERLQRTFNKQDRKEDMMMGVGGGVTEADELLSAIRVAHEGACMQKSEN